MSTIPHVNLGKKALLDWVNDFFQIGYTKIEECANAALYCQVMDCLFPGRVPLSKVNFNAKLEHEFVSNYKVLQNVLANEKIDKYVDVERLCRAKFQDNLEFLQWVKGCFDHFYDGQPYDAVARRREAASKNPLAARREGAAAAAGAAGASGASHAPPARTSPAHATGARTSPNPVQKPRSTATGAATAALSTGASMPRAKPVASRAPATTHASAGPSTRSQAPAATASAAGSSGLKTETQLRQRIAELERKLAAETNRREQLAFQQAFYYAKLREVELICLNDKLAFDDSMRQTLLEVMYKPDHDPALEPEEAEVEDTQYDQGTPDTAVSATSAATPASEPFSYVDEPSNTTPTHTESKQPESRRSSQGTYAQPADLGEAYTTSSETLDAAEVPNTTEESGPSVGQSRPYTPGDPDEF